MSLIPRLLEACKASFSLICSGNLSRNCEIEFRISRISSAIFDKKSQNKFLTKVKKLKEPIQNRPIFAEIDILTLSVTRFFIVGSQWKALEKIFPMRSKNLKSSHGQDQDIDF